eukprot:5867405-Pyramimonas_sp.AAC.1
MNKPQVPCLIYTSRRPKSYYLVASILAPFGRFSNDGASRFGSSSYLIMGNIRALFLGLDLGSSRGKGRPLPLPKEASILSRLACPSVRMEARNIYCFPVCTHVAQVSPPSAQILKAEATAITRLTCGPSNGITPCMMHD